MKKIREHEIIHLDKSQFHNFLRVVLLQVTLLNLYLTGDLCQDYKYNFSKKLCTKEKRHIELIHVVRVCIKQTKSWCTHPSPSVWMEPPSRCRGEWKTSRSARSRISLPAAASASQLGIMVGSPSCFFRVPPTIRDRVIRYNLIENIIVYKGCNPHVQHE